MVMSQIKYLNPKFTPTKNKFAQFRDALNCKKRNVWYLMAGHHFVKNSHIFMFF